MVGHFVGLDIGTQGIKVVAVSDHGAVVWKWYQPYAIDNQAHGWVEQRPQDWLRVAIGALDALRETGLEIHGLGFTGQMHSIVLTDGAGEPLRPAILWSDTRAQEESVKLLDRFGLSFLQEQTGNYPLPNLSLFNLLWVQYHEPAVWENVRHFYLAKDWVRYHLTRVTATDVTDASGTYAFDVKRRQWNHAWLDALQVDSGWFPPAYESHRVVGTLRHDSRLNGVPVIVGAGDQSASALALGVTTSHQVALSLGTSGVVLVPLEDYQVAPHVSAHSFCHAKPKMWHWMGVTQSATQSLSWLQNILGGTLSFGEMDSEAATVSPGAEGLTFLPYLNGERAPIHDPHARGMFFGLRAHHTRAHLIRSVMEGVALSLRDVVDSFGPEIRPTDRLLATGGGLNSTLWSVILASCLERPLNIVQTPGAAYGAAWLAYRGVRGSDPGWELPMRRVEPSAHAPRYQDQLKVYRDIYRDTRHILQEGVIQ